MKTYPTTRQVSFIEDLYCSIKLMIFDMANVECDEVIIESRKKFNEITTYINSIDPSFSSIRFPKFTNFKKQEEFESSASMKSVALDSKVLRGTFTGDNNKSGEGLFMASIVNFGNQYNGGVDMLY